MLVPQVPKDEEVKLTKKKSAQMREYQHGAETIIDYQRSIINSLSSDQYLFDCRINYCLAWW